MTTESAEKLQVATLFVLVATMILILIVAVGNWQLFARVKRIETTLGLPAMRQSPEKP